MRHPFARTRLVAALATALLLGACASSGASPAPVGDAAASEQATRASARARRQSDLITEAEIVESRSLTAREVVERLRPTYLRTSNPRFPVLVYVNGVRRGGLGALQDLRADDLQSIRRLNASDAQTRYGPDHLSGAIEIVTKPGRG